MAFLVQVANVPKTGRGCAVLVLVPVQDGRWRLNTIYLACAARASDRWRSTSNTFYPAGPMVVAGVLHYLPAPFLPRPELYAIYVTLTVRAIPSWCSRATRAGRCSEPDEQAVNPTLVVLVLADAGAEIYGRCHRAPHLPSSCNLRSFVPS